MRNPIKLSALGLITLMVASCGMQTPAATGTTIDEQPSQQADQQVPPQAEQQAEQQDQTQAEQQADQPDQPADQKQVQADQQQGQQVQSNNLDDLLSQANQAVDQNNFDQAIAQLNQIKDQLGSLGIQDQEKLTALQSKIDQAIQDITNAQVNRQEVASIAISQIDDAIGVEVQGEQSTVQATEEEPKVPEGTTAEQHTTPTEAVQQGIVDAPAEPPQAETTDQGNTDTTEDDQE